MNEEELKTNKEVNEYVVHDLNLEPALPFPDNTFDIVTNAVSVDYLNKPLEVFQEIHRWAGGVLVGLGFWAPEVYGLGTLEVYGVEGCGGFWVGRSAVRVSNDALHRNLP